MKLTILTIGSGGDVQPYLALAVALKQKGYDVTLVTGNNFESFVGEWNVNFLPLRADFQSLIESDEGKKVLSNPLRSGKFIREAVRPMFKNLLGDAWKAAQGSDILIYHPKVLAGPHIAERLGIPSAIAITAPIITPTGAFPMPGLVNKNLGGTLNRASYNLMSLSLVPFSSIVQDWRQAIGLAAKPSKKGLRYARGKRLPVLY